MNEKIETALWFVFALVLAVGVGFTGKYMMHKKRSMALEELREEYMQALNACHLESEKAHVLLGICLKLNEEESK